jgi:hypothetical protein
MRQLRISCCGAPSLKRERVCSLYNCYCSSSALSFSGLNPVGQSSWLQIQRSGFDSRPYLIFWKVVGLERGPFSLVSTIEGLLGRNSSGSDLESREYGRRDPSSWLCDILYPQKLALTSPTSAGHSVGVVRSWAQATEFSLVSFTLVLSSHNYVVIKK